MFWIRWLVLINLMNSAEGSLCQLNKLFWSLYKLYKLANCWHMYFNSNASHFKLFLILLSYLPNPRNLSSLWDSRRCVAFRRRPKMVEFIPTTFRMDLRTERERLSIPATRVRHAGHLHQPAGHPVTPTTQHWFNWICVWSKSSSLKPETRPDACPTMMGNKVILCSLMLWQRLPQWLFN